MINSLFFIYLLHREEIVQGHLDLMANPSRYRLIDPFTPGLLIKILHCLFYYYLLSTSYPALPSGLAELSELDKSASSSFTHF